MFFKCSLAGRSQYRATEAVLYGMLRKMLKRLGLAYLICGLLTGIVGGLFEARLMKDEGASKSQIVRMEIEGLIGSLFFWPAIVYVEAAVYFGVIPRHQRPSEASN
jgi:hypothetical protein